MTKIKNHYEIRGSVTAIFLNSPKYGTKEALIDTADLPKALEFPNTWCAHYDPTIDGFYCRGKIHLPNRKSITVYLHRWITDCPFDKQIDHFDNDTLNNCGNNLRIVTAAENQQNLKGAQSNSRSGVLGVYWNKGCKKWVGQVEVGGKKKTIGMFSNIPDAAAAVKKARSELMPFSKEAAGELSGVH